MATGKDNSKETLRMGVAQQVPSIGHMQCSNGTHGACFFPRPLASPYHLCFESPRVLGPFGWKRFNLQGALLSGLDQIAIPESRQEIERIIKS